MNSIKVESYQCVYGTDVTPTVNLKLSINKQSRQLVGCGGLSKYTVVFRLLRDALGWPSECLVKYINVLYISQGGNFCVVTVAVHNNNGLIGSASERGPISMEDEIMILAMVSAVENLLAKKNKEAAV